MTSGRMEAFSDGVLAIILTIMVLELRPPEGDTLAALGPLWPKLTAYLLSFVMVGIYWNNHHHLLHAVDRVDGGVLWANLHLLFWLSLIPFGTAWMGEHSGASAPVAIYGVVLLAASIAYYVLSRALLALHEPGSALAQALGSDWKGRLSTVAYVVAIPLSYLSRWLAFAVFVGVAIVWLVPDRRISRTLDPGDVEHPPV